jgi:hypothetical protein
MFNDSPFHVSKHFRPGWPLFVGSNAVLLVFGILIVNSLMGKAPEKVIVSEPAQAVAVTVAGVSDSSVVRMTSAVQPLKPHLFRPGDLLRGIRPWQQMILKYSLEFGVDPYLVAAVLYIESKGNPNSVSSKGAIGLMQITPATAHFLGFQDVTDPEENIKAGVKYIARLVDTYDESSALQVYNAGTGIFERGHVPRETTRFVERVLFLKRFLEGGKKDSDLS